MLDTEQQGDDISAGDMLSDKDIAKTFIDLKAAISQQFNKMLQHELFISKANKNELWDTYLSSFPEGSNPIYRERTQHDCNCCKQFIRSAGNTLAIINDELVSIWDIDIGGHYQVVANAMSSLTKLKGIENIFLHDTRDVGTDKSHEHGENGIITWDHFHHELTDKFIVSRASIATLKGKARTNNDVLKRSLEEITSDAIEVVIELIEQNSLYRGEEHLRTLNMLFELKNKYDDAINKDYFTWLSSLDLKGASAIRNTVIGTLLVDLSNGIDLEDAVRMFESKVAPQNYKRPTALITKSMIDKANATVQELGFEDALYRRFAIKGDISINDILFADRSIKEAAGVFDVIKDDVIAKKPKLDKIEKVTIGDFIKNIVPKATSIELYLENKHTNNLVNLIAPVHENIKNILKWDNNFSWSYNGEVTDSIRDRVKSAGGSVTGDLRCSLAWGNADDLDIHIKEPCGNEIFFSRKSNPVTGGRLDVDMNAGGRNNSVDPVENITWPNKDKMKEGIYTLIINNYNKRSNENLGFAVEVEFNGVVHTFNHPKAIANKKNVEVATFSYSKTEGLKIVKSIPSTAQSKEIWGINTNNFHKVSMIMHSPNRWNGAEYGNKHFFFMLDNCINPDKARGLYNEFLSNELTEHRKVFEILGAKLKAEKSTDQLAGVGFSSTQKNSVLCKVQGAFNRTVEIQF